MLDKRILTDFWVTLSVCIRSNYSFIAVPRKFSLRNDCLRGASLVDYTIGIRCIIQLEFSTCAYRDNSNVTILHRVEPAARGRDVGFD